MPPRMTTRSAGQATAAPRGGRTGGRTGGQGSEVNGGVDEVPDFSTMIAQQLKILLPTIVAQVGSQGSDQGIGSNQNGDAVNDDIQGDVWNFIENNDRRGCAYKEFLACNPKEYDGKGGAIVYIRWIEKMESVQDMSGCRDNQKIRRMVAATEPTTIRKAMQIAGILTDEAIRNGSLKKNHEKRGNGGEPSKDRNGRDDNKRTRTGNAFATTTNPVRRENMGTTPKCTTCNFHHPPETPCRTCFNCNLPRHFTKDCRVVPRNMNPINARKPTMRTCYEWGSTNHFKAACPSFVSTTFIPLLGIEPSDLGFSYEIEIASGQLVEIDKVIKGCKLEIEGHEFDINLIPFGSGSFDVIIGMDWLSNHKAEIICHEKVIKIPLPDGKVLRVIREIPKEKMKHVMSAKAKEQKQEEMVVVRDFPEVFSNTYQDYPLFGKLNFGLS
ncbi:putative reverse transcriptase domain-containing protein [Tanacetum coccineum]